MRNPEFALIGTINALGKKIRRFCDRNAARLGLTGTQGHVLCFIFIVSQWQDIYQRDIEEEFEISRSTATGILKLLERDGFIERVSVPADARLKKIVLTPKAKELQPLVIREAMAANQLLRSRLTDEETATYIRLSERICDTIT